jgi:hypothetical protein
MLDEPTLASQRSQPSPSPPGDPGDNDDDNGIDDDNNNAGPGSSPQRSLPPDTSNPHGAGGPREGKGQYPPALRKHTEEEEAIPWNHTKTSWAAYNIAREYECSTHFERYATGKNSEHIVYAEMLVDFFTPPGLKSQVQAANIGVDLAPTIKF